MGRCQGRTGSQEGIQGSGKLAAFAQSSCAHFFTQLLAKARNTAMQLVTLTEFAELHLEAKVESVQVQSSYLLAEACLATEKACEFPALSMLISSLTLMQISCTSGPRSSRC